MRITSLFGAAVCLLVSAAYAAETKVGGRTAVDVHDEGVQKAAKFAFDRMTAIAGEPIKKYEVVKAERQVVAGLLYYLEVDVKATTKCETHTLTVYDHFGDYSISERHVAPCAADKK